MLARKTVKTVSALSVAQSGLGTRLYAVRWICRRTTFETNLVIVGGVIHQKA